MKQVNVTETRQCVSSTIDHGEQIDHRKYCQGKSEHTNKGRGKHAKVVEKRVSLLKQTTTALAIAGGYAEERMDMVRPETEEAQNTLTAELLSGSLLPRPR